MFVDDYKPGPIRPSRVETEGDYELMILEVTKGSTRDGSRYLRIKCKIRYEGEPRVSFFLTEGPSFEGRATAMFDTFGIERGDWNTEGWRGKRGYMHIRLRQKDGYINMDPEFILDDEGYARGSGPAPRKVNEMAMYTDEEQELEDIPF